MKMWHGVTDDGNVDMFRPGNLPEGPAGTGGPPAYALGLGISKVLHAWRMPSWFDKQMA